MTRIHYAGRRLGNRTYFPTRPVFADKEKARTKAKSYRRQGLLARVTKEGDGYIVWRVAG